MKFKFLTGDENYLQYGGKWYRKVGEGVYHVITLVNMWDATGDEDQEKYNVQLEEIDLNEISQKNIDSAVSCCGWNDPDNLDELQIVESISVYGCFAFMGTWNGNNFKSLFQTARDESYRLNDSDYHEAQMNRPVNKIGSTAREAMQGDFISGMIRGIASGDKNARIMGKIHGLNDEDLNQIEGDEDLKNWNR